MSKQRHCAFLFFVLVIWSLDIGAYLGFDAWDLLFSIIACFLQRNMVIYQSVILSKNPCSSERKMMAWLFIKIDFAV